MAHAKPKSNDLAALLGSVCLEFSMVESCLKMMVSKLLSDDAQIAAIVVSEASFPVLVAMAKSLLEPNPRTATSPPMLKRFIAMFDISLHAANAIFNAANALLIFGAVIVAVGTIAAFWTAGIRERFADERISNNEKATALADAEAQRAKADIAEAQKVAAQAQKDAAEANSHLAEANAAAAAAQKDAAQARLEGEKLKALVSWREIPTEKRESFKLLAENLPKGAVVVASIAGNSEAANFASQISEMLKSAGYDVSENLASMMSFGGSPPTGVRLKVKSAALAPPYAAPLQHALEAVGIKAPGEIDGMAGDTVQIFVGNKP